MSLVIIEGGDGSGKTTLVNELKKLYTQNAKFVKDERGKYTEGDWVCFVRNMDLIISDRSFIGDMVYRCYDNTYGDLTLSQIQNIIQWQDVKIVLCQTDTSFEDGMARGEDNIVDKQKAEAIKKTYFDVCTILNKFANIPLYIYNWKNDTPQSVVNFIRST